MAIEAPFTPEHEQFRSNLRRYVERELAPHALEWDEAGIFPREVFQQLAELGAIGINYPEAVGGSGGDYWHVGWQVAKRHPLIGSGAGTFDLGWAAYPVTIANGRDWAAMRGFPSK